jgi:hypothetical protein
VPHAWKNSGPDTGRALFLYTPAAAGLYVEEMFERQAPLSEGERDGELQRHRWALLGPNPL